MTTQKAKIILVEDNESYRRVIDRTLRNQPDFQLINHYGTAEVALREVSKATHLNTPDLILLDLNLPGMGGLEALTWFKKYAPQTHIIILTQSKQEADILKAIQLGASGYLLKSSTAAQIIDGIRTVLTGGASLDAKVTRIIFHKLKHEPQSLPTEGDLTEREHEILIQISEGMEKKDIAASLDISANTVAYHVKNIYEKLDVSNAPAAVRQAFRTGILKPDE